MSLQQGQTRRNGERVRYYRWGDDGEMHIYEAGDLPAQAEAKVKAKQDGDGEESENVALRDHTGAPMHEEPQITEPIPALRDTIELGDAEILGVGEESYNSTAGDHQYRACQHCRTPVKWNEPHVQAKVRRTTKFASTYETPAFCSKDCFLEWYGL